MTYGQGYETMLVVNDFFKLANNGQSCAKTEPVKKKENPMYVDYVTNDKHTESAKTNYLLQRASNVKYKIQEDLRIKFGLNDDETPHTAQELVDRITSGKYILPTEKEAELLNDRCWPYPSAMAGIKWRDPAVKEDRAGYKAAEKQLETAFDDVHDAVMIKSNDDALAAIKEFETWKPAS